MTTTDDDSPIGRWVHQAGDRYVELLDRIDRAYLNAEAAAKAADERSRDRANRAETSVNEQPWVPGEQLPRVHVEAMQTYAGIASALLSSIREIQMASTLDVQIPVES